VGEKSQKGIAKEGFIVIIEMGINQTSAGAPHAAAEADIAHRRHNLCAISSVSRKAENGTAKRRALTFSPASLVHPSSTEVYPSTGTSSSTRSMPEVPKTRPTDAGPHRRR